MRHSTAARPVATRRRPLQVGSSAILVKHVLNRPPAGSGRDKRILSIQVDADGPSTLARSKVCDSPVFAGSQGELDLAPQVDSPVRNPPITMERRPAPRAEALIGEQLSQRSGGQQSPTALEAGKWCHAVMIRGCARRYSIQRLNRPELQATRRAGTVCESPRARRRRRDRGRLLFAVDLVCTRGRRPRWPAGDLRQRELPGLGVEPALALRPVTGRPARAYTRLRRT
jgi:hypothetical protein